MTWQFERVAGRMKARSAASSGTTAPWCSAPSTRAGCCGFDHDSTATSEFRRYANRVNGLGRGPGGELYGAQEGGRRLVEFTPDGRVVAVDALLDGKYHNQPCDLTVDTQRPHLVRRSAPCGDPVRPAIFPYLDHASVLRLERNDRRAWVARRITYDTVRRAPCCCPPDETVLYVADGEPRPGERRELRAYPIGADGTVGHPAALHSFGADHRGPQRGIEGMCLDADGNIVACAGWNAGAGRGR